MLTECTRSDICLEGRGSDMPAQGIALGIGSGVENSNALKGRTGLWSRILFRPFRAGRILIRIGSPGPTPQAGFPPPGLSVSAPSGRQKSATSKFARGGKMVTRLRNGGKTAQRNREESAACARPSFHQPRPARSAAGGDLSVFERPTLSRTAPDAVRGAPETSRLDTPTDRSASLMPGALTGRGTSQKLRSAVRCLNKESRYFYSARSIGVENENDAGEVAKSLATSLKRKRRALNDPERWEAEHPRSGPLFRVNGGRHVLPLRPDRSSGDGFGSRITLARCVGADPVTTAIP